MTIVQGFSNRRRPHSRPVITPPGARRATPFVPPRVSPETAVVERRLFAPRVPYDLTALGRAWRLKVARPARALEQTSVDFDLSIGGERAILRAPWALAEQFLFAADPAADLEQMSAETASMLVEAGAIAQIEALERALGRSIAFETFREPAKRGRAHLDMMLTGADAGDSWRLTLFAAPQTLAAAAALWETRPLVIGPLAQAAPFPVIARVGSAVLSAADVAALEPGDAVVMQSYIGAGQAVLTAGDDSFAAAGRLGAAKNGLRAVQLDEPLSAAAARRHAETLMTETPDATSPTAPEDATLDALPVRLVFEIGRAVLPLSDLQTLTQGSVISLEAAPGPRVDILANDKRVAVGEIVTLGEEVGVRILSLTADV